MYIDLFNISKDLNMYEPKTLKWKNCISQKSQCYNIYDMFGRIVIVRLELLILPRKINGDIAWNGGSPFPVQYQTQD